MNRPTLLILVALNALFVTVLVGEWFAETEVPAIQKVEQKQDEVEIDDLPTLEMLTETSEDNYSDLVEHPMFIKGRKPVNEPEPENTSVTEVKRMDVFVWNLTGIFTTSKGMTAFLNRTNTKVEKDNYRKIKVGDELDGWKMTEIQSDKIILTQSGETKTLLLHKAKPKNAPNNSIPTQPPSIQPQIKAPQEVQMPTATQNPDDLSEETVNPENL